MKNVQIQSVDVCLLLPLRSSMQGNCNSVNCTRLHMFHGPLPPNLSCRPHPDFPLLSTATHSFVASALSQPPPLLFAACHLAAVGSKNQKQFNIMVEYRAVAKHPSNCTPNCFILASGKSLSAFFDTAYPLWLVPVTCIPINFFDNISSFRGK